MRKRLNVINFESKSQSYYQLGKIQISFNKGWQQIFCYRSQSYYQLGKIQISVFTTEILTDLTDESQSYYQLGKIQIRGFPIKQTYIDW